MVGFIQNFVLLLSTLHPGRFLLPAGSELDEVQDSFPVVVRQLPEQIQQLLLFGGRFGYIRQQTSFSKYNFWRDFKGQIGRAHV